MSYVGDDVQDALLQIATIAGQVQSTAQAAAGGVPAAQFANRYKWPLVIGASALIGAAAVLVVRGAKR